MSEHTPAHSPAAPASLGPAHRKVGVVGAGGVGTAICYAALIRGVAREVALYDIDEPQVRAEVLDLAHGTPFTSASAMTGGADPDVLAGCEVVVITAGAKQKPGQTRLDLGAHNVEILRGLRGLDVVACDVVEVAPAYDHAEITGIAAAHVVYELITLISLGPDAAPDGPAYGISGARYGAGK